MIAIIIKKVKLLIGLLIIEYHLIRIKSLRKILIHAVDAGVPTTNERLVRLSGKIPEHHYKIEFAREKWVRGNIPAKRPAANKI